jgi:hypothetical protein
VQDFINSSMWSTTQPAITSNFEGQKFLGSRSYAEELAEEYRRMVYAE